jgi:hypothetical protein
VGVGGRLYAAELYDNGLRVLTAASVTTATLQAVTNVGFTTTNRINITNNTVSTSTTTGALAIGGGVGVGGSIYVGNRMGFVNTSNVSVVYQVYNPVTNSLDTVFG